MKNAQNTKKETTSKVLNTIFTVFIAIVIIFSLAFTIIGLSSKNNNEIPSLFGQGYVTVISDSMKADDEKIADNKTKNYPCPEGFKRGDILLVQTYSSTDLEEMLAREEYFKVGDVVTFPAIINKVQDKNTHRIINVLVDDNGNVSYITQGDANDASDLPIAHRDILASYKSSIKGVGSIFLFLQQPVGFLICIVLPLVLLLVLEAFNFAKAIKAYRLEKAGISADATDEVPAAPEKTAEELQAEIERLRKQLESQKKDDE